MTQPQATVEQIASAIRGAIPDLTESFHTFADSLKAAAEARA